MKGSEDANKVFHTIGALDNLWQPFTFGRNVIDSPRYHYEGANRTFDQPHTIFQYTLSGEGEVVYDGKKHKVPQGYGFFCNSHDPKLVYYYPASNVEPWTIIYITFINLQPLCHDCCSKYGPVFQLPENSPIITALNRMLDAKGNHINLKKHQAMELASQAVSSVLHSFELMHEKRSGHVLVYKVWRFIEENINEPLSVDTIASVVGVTREHLSRVFKEEEGISLAKYIRRMKVREAGRLFLSGETTVKEVSAKLGFDNTSNFIRTFKKETGITPGDYIANHFGS